MNFTENTLANLRDYATIIGAEMLEPVAGRADAWMITLHRNGAMAVACDADTGMVALFPSHWDAVQTALEHARKQRESN
jgi:hypothetical protein